MTTAQNSYGHKHRQKMVKEGGLFVNVKVPRARRRVSLIRSRYYYFQLQMRVLSAAINSAMAEEDASKGKEKLL